MAAKIRMSIGSLEILVELNDSETSQKLLAALPFSASARLWGDEIYFDSPVTMGPETPKEVVDKGEVGYWPPGRALCLFFGPTPSSRGDEIRPASPVNPVGKILSELAPLTQVKEGETIEVSLAEVD